MAKNSITLAVITPGSLLDRGSHIGECHATVWRMPCNRLANAMQPFGECHATVWRMPCNRLANAMQPFGERHATVWRTPCNRLANAAICLRMMHEDR